MDVEVLIEWIIKAGAVVGAVGVLSQYDFTFAHLHPYTLLYKQKYRKRW